MAITAIDTIKNWFKTGQKPTQAQFWAVFDSFRHKGDKVPVADVDGINELLAAKASKIEVSSKENSSNKAKDLSVFNDVLYPTTKAVKEAIALMGSASYMGVAKPTDNPGAQTTPKFWTTSEPGTYTNFGGLIVPVNTFVVISWNGTAWVKSESVLAPLKQVTGTDANTAMSQKAVTDALNKEDFKIGAFDILSGWGAGFNGNEGCSVTPILIKNDGDAIEFEVTSNTASNTTGGYSFMGNAVHGGIMINNGGITLRDKNNAWLIDLASEVKHDFTKKTKVKFEVASTNVNLYLDGVLKKTVSVGAGIEIVNIGDSYYPTYPRWKGVLGYINLTLSSTTTAYPLINYLSGFTNNGVALKMTRSEYFLTTDQLAGVNSGTSANNLLKSVNLATISLTSTATVASVCTLPTTHFLTSIGDYVEIVCANKGTLTDSRNISMFGLASSYTLGGYYLGKFYFRSNSNSGADYRIWDLPVGFDKTKFHKIKLLYTATGWELFIDGISMGIKPISDNCNFNQLVGGKVDNLQYDYSSVVVHSSTSGDFSYNAYVLANYSQNYRLYSNTDERVSALETKMPELEQDIADSDAKISDNASKITLIAGDNFYSKHNSNAPTTISSTTLAKTYSLKSIGDYFEIVARYTGGNTNYADKLTLIGGSDTGSRFGWYNQTQIWFRVAYESYKIWTITGIDWSEWHAYKLLVVSGGFELFIDGVSFGVVADNLAGVTYSVANIATETPSAGADRYQKYDTKTFKIVSAENGQLDIPSLSAYSGSVNVIPAYDAASSSDSGVINNPLCFVTWDSVNKKMFVYLRDREKQEIYYSFTILLFSSRGTVDDKIFYKHHWFLQPLCSKATYNSKTNSMLSSSVTLITDGESECVYHQTDANGKTVIDFSGGVHGDETIDITPGDFIRFYLNGVPLTDDELASSFTLRPCNEFYYLQKSSIHKTGYVENNVESNITASGAGVLSIQNSRFYIDDIDTGFDAFNQNTVYRTVAEATADGVSITKSTNNKWQFSFLRIVHSAHPVVCTHFKKTTFKGQGFESENTLIFLDTQQVSIWYHGICCISKQVMLIGHNEDYNDITFNSDGATKLSKVGHRLFEAYNPTTKMSGRVTSKIVNGGGVVDDKNCTMFIVDRANDSKYYRNTGAFNPPVGVPLVSLMTVEYNYKVE